jgi:hypothetical protein
MTSEINDQIRLYKVLSEERIRLFLVIIAIIVFITLFIFFLTFLCQQKYTQCKIAGSSDFVFAAIIFIVYRHYFK